jgi:hypothetical protein
MACRSTCSNEFVARTTQTDKTVRDRGKTNNNPDQGSSPMSEIKKTKTGKPLGDYDVGYAKPPKATQFPKGRSGNPKGRAKKTEREVVDMVRDAIRRQIPVREGDQVRSAPYMELFFTDWSNKALKGTAKEKSEFYKALRENFPGALVPDEPEPDAASVPVKPLNLIYPAAPAESGKAPTTPSTHSAAEDKP